MRGMFSAVPLSADRCRPCRRLFHSCAAAPPADVGQLGQPAFLRQRYQLVWVGVTPFTVWLLHGFCGLFGGTVNFTGFATLQLLLLLSPGEELTADCCPLLHSGELLQYPSCMFQCVSTQLHGTRQFPAETSFPKPDTEMFYARSRDRLCLLLSCMLWTQSFKRV
ncbi:uncharacterized protein V6R79_000922 [Siganus canaliculatus]